MKALLRTPPPPAGHPSKKEETARRQEGGEEMVTLRRLKAHVRKPRVVDKGAGMTQVTRFALALLACLGLATSSVGAAWPSALHGVRRWAGAAPLHRR